ncbi:oxidoreductase [Halorubrum sp. Hd13]|nr:oxidoreductase [Halorubrum sp. Hd13]
MAALTDSDAEDTAQKVALITGASSGIGRSTAETLAREGVRVALAARRKDKLQQLKERVESDGGTALVVETDITDEDDVREAIEQIENRFGRLDILVNSAGMMILDQVEEADITEFQRMIDVNLNGLMRVTQAVLPLMQRQGSGHVVNISSLAGRKSFPGASGYSASKYAVNGFSEALREEFSGEDTEYIRVTDIEPGFVETDLSEGLPPEWMETLDPADVARSVRYAVSQPPHVDVNEILLRPTQMEL